MRAEAQAQPNIALIKYWGKRDVERNIPATGSLSITLDTLWTRMAVRFVDGARDSLEINGETSPKLLARVSGCLDHLCGTRRRSAIVESAGNFPIGAGLASSASAFAALVMAGAAAANLPSDRQALARLAGSSSGSAARSFYPGIVELEVGDDGIVVETLAAVGDWPLEVVVAVTDEGAKPLTSGEAMLRCSRTSPFYPAWVERQSSDLRAARDAVRTRDFARLAVVSEHNCLKMHSVMWAARPSIVYWNQATIACMETVRELQRGGLPVFFTIDAGPQVKAVCLPEAADAVAGALSATAGVHRVLTSGLGEGARLLDAA